jgi:heme-degrading monooxygenase HmoA
MFVRIVAMQLKPNTGQEFTQVFESQIIPTLRKQPGFTDEMLLVDPDGPEVVAISLWDSKQNAETYSRTTYPEVLKTLAKVIERTPQVRTFEVAHSTFHKMATHAAA